MNIKKYIVLLFLLIMPSHTKEHDFGFYILLAHGYTQKKEFNNALNMYKKAIKLRPNDYEANKDLANKLLQLGNLLFDVDPKKAIESFKLILEISPNIYQVHHNIGFTLTERLGAYEESLPWYEKALQLKTTDAGTHFCYALSLLATQNLPQGFAHYEWRWERPLDTRPRKSFSMNLPKQWRGESLKNKRIAIRVEQGLGDTLHFIRFARELKRLGAYTIAEVQSPLVKLLSMCDYLDEVISIEEPLPPFDYQIPMLSIPTVLKTTIETIPTDIPYLYASPPLIEQWKKELQNQKKFKIGICWYGDKVHGQVKFMPFKFFEQLADIPNVALYSLQFGPEAEQLKSITQENIYTFYGDFDNSHGRFMDTAAIMKNLDLMITVDTSIAHLAGGLGIPVWVALPFPAEWRWFQKRSDSPWYPTMKLFRQKEKNNWHSVIEEIKRELQELI